MMDGKIMRKGNKIYIVMPAIVIGNERNANLISFVSI
jgi:hypothetical protein